MSELKPNSISDEYYLGDLPGTIQYSKGINELAGIKNLHMSGGDRGFVQIPPVDDDWKKFITANYQKGHGGEWTVLVVFKKEVGEGEVWMKAALLNKKTGAIALTTCANGKEYITRHLNAYGKPHRAVKSLERGWFVGHYRMGAPMVFWRAVAEEARRLVRGE